MNEQIEAIKAGLAALDTAISQTQAALATATNIEDTRALTSRLVDLRSERSRLQVMLNNLEAADVEVAGMQAADRPVAPKGLKSAHQKLATVHEDRTLIKAAMGFSGDVLKNSADMRQILSAGMRSANQRKRR
jgi:hypothetical protein